MLSWRCVGLACCWFWATASGSTVRARPCIRDLVVLRSRRCRLWSSSIRAVKVCVVIHSSFHQLQVLDAGLLSKSARLETWQVEDLWLGDLSPHVRFPFDHGFRLVDFVELDLLQMLPVPWLSSIKRRNLLLVEGRSGWTVRCTLVDIVSVFVGRVELSGVVPSTEGVLDLVLVGVFEFAVDQGQLVDVFESGVVGVEVVDLGALVGLADVLSVLVLVQAQRLHFVRSHDHVGGWVPLGDCLAGAYIARGYVGLLLHVCGVGQMALINYGVPACSAE